MHKVVCDKINFDLLNMESNKRKILILGGLGFLGLNFARYLRNSAFPFSVFALNLDPQLEDKFSQLGINYISGDVTDYESVASAVAKHDWIINFSGRSGALNGLRDPYADINVNLVGVLNTLEAVRKVNTSAKIVFAGSRLEYGKIEDMPVSETHPSSPTSLYGIQKLLAEKYHSQYALEYNISALTLRFTNPFGPHLAKNFAGYNVLNYFMDLAQANQEIQIFGDGLQKRDYIYTDDLGSSIIAAFEHGKGGEVYNIGSGTGIPLIEAAEKIVEISKSGKIKQIPWPADYQAVEMGDYIADITKAKTSLKWAPKVTFEDGVKRTLDFQHSNPSDLWSFFEK